MKGKTVLKILLDVVMTVLYVLLVFELGTGAFFHETVGIGIGVLFILHVLLNLKLIRGLRRSVITGKASTSKKLLYYSDVFLPFGMFVAIVTGVLILRVLFSMNIGAVGTLVYAVHNISSYICLAILLSHVLLHSKCLAPAIKQLFNNWRSKQVIKSVSGFAAIAMVLYIGDSTVYSSYKKANAYYVASSISETVSGNTAAPQTAIGAVITTASPNSGAEDDDDSDIVNKTQSTALTLTQFLGTMICTGCHKRCLLTSPQCSIGRTQAEKAKVSYEQQYGTTN